MANPLTDALATAVSAVNPFSAIANTIGTLVERLVPDKAEAARVQAQIAALGVSADLELARAQLEVNKAEASSGSWFVAGGRPALLWACAFGVLGLVLIWIWLPPLALAFHRPDVIPDEPGDGILDFVYWLLATLIGVRGVETLAGKERRSMRPKKH